VEQEPGEPEQVPVVVKQARAVPERVGQEPEAQEPVVALEEEVVN
jgi:hypothetical protein